MSDRRPLNEKGYYHWYEHSGELTIESECCLDRFSADEERVLLRYLLGKHPQRPDPTTLRAEVERMRSASVWREEGWGPDEERLKAASHAVDAYTRVLDLIDKHTREGQ